MVNSTHLIKLKSTLKKGIRSSSASGPNEDENSFKETANKVLFENNNRGESLFDIIRNIVKEEFKLQQHQIINEL